MANDDKAVLWRAAVYIHARGKLVRLVRAS